jgi:hypothetical protein
VLVRERAGRASVWKREPVGSSHCDGKAYNGRMIDTTDYGRGPSPHIDHSALWRIQTGYRLDDVQASHREREVLRCLAEKVAAHAASPRMAERRELWRRHNQLEGTRPLILCDPENGWNEIITERQLQCQGTVTRRWEAELRKEIFWAEEMGDDKPIEPFFDVPYTVSPDDWGLHAVIDQADVDGSKTWRSPLADYETDFARLHEPHFAIDWPTTHGCVQLAKDLFGDLLTVRLKGTWWWSLGITLVAVFFRHIDQMYLDMIDRPDALKALFALISRGWSKKLDYLEQQGLLSLNNDGTYVGSGGYGFTRELPAGDFSGTVRCEDLWGFCESQETVNISPRMYEEFVFPYEKPLLDRFGLNCYGCCEPVHGRWHIVRRHARLRRVSCSPWADLRKMADHLQDKYITSMKPSPAPLASDKFDCEKSRQELRAAFEVTRHCHVECIMKDNHTLGNRPENVTEWCRVAKEEASRIPPV